MPSKRSFVVHHYAAKVAELGRVSNAEAFVISLLIFGLCFGLCLYGYLHKLYLLFWVMLIPTLLIPVSIIQDIVLFITAKRK